MLRLDDNSARVLVIATSMHIRRLVITLLGALNIKACEEARTLPQAAAQVQRNLPDLIVLDLDGDATEAMLFAHRLRRGEFGQGTPPVLGLSLSDHHAMLQMAWEAGISEIVTKPLSALEILHRASALLGLRPTIADTPVPAE